jgi:hypothetical protein
VHIIQIDERWREVFLQRRAHQARIETVGSKMPVHALTGLLMKFSWSSNVYLNKSQEDKCSVEKESRTSKPPRMQ